MTQIPAPRPSRTSGLRRVTGRQPTLMMVDDTPANLKLLHAVLETRGCELRSFTSGEHALRAAMEDPPDLVLLDIAMPVMNGFEVCRRLQANPRTAPVPVIFLTALDSTEEKVTAFACGGVDYVTKPFQLEELWARVSTHLQLRALSLQLEKHNRELDRLVAERTAELAEAHRQLEVLDRAKSGFLQLMAHELRTPLNGVLGVGELLIEQCPPGASTDELAGMFQSSRSRIMNLVENAELLTRLEVGARSVIREQVDLVRVLRSAIEAVPPKSIGVATWVDPPPTRQGPVVLGDRALLTHAFRSLLKVAARFCTSPAGLSVRWHVDPAAVTVRIEAEGTHVPPALLATFFENDAVRPANTGIDLGLDPSVAAQILGVFEARVSVENLPEPGLRLTAVLPAPAATDAPGAGPAPLPVHQAA